MLRWINLFICVSVSPSSRPMDKISFNIALLSYLVASLGYFVYLVYRRPFVSTLAGGMVAMGLVSQTISIGIRSSLTGHGPYTTSYEVAMFLAWFMVVIYVLMEWKYKIKDLGAFVIPLVFFSNVDFDIFIEGCGPCS